MTDMIRRLGAAARTEFGLGLGGGSFYVIGNASYLRVGYFLKREKLTKLCDIYRKHMADIEFNYQFDQKDDRK